MTPWPGGQELMPAGAHTGYNVPQNLKPGITHERFHILSLWLRPCLLYKSDAADEVSPV